MHLLQQCILVLPQMVDPALALQAVFAILVVVFADELWRDLQFFKVHHHIPYIAAQQVPEAWTSARVEDGHVEDRFQLFAHRMHQECNAAGLGL